MADRQVMLGSQLIQRRINVSHVMRALRDQAPLSRAEIARHTGLTKSTVTNVIRDLSRRGLIGEGEHSADRSPGRPPVLLSFAHAPSVVGVELRPAVVRVVVVGLDGETRAQRAQPVERVEPVGSSLSGAWEVCERVLEDMTSERCVGLSVAVPATVNPVVGRLLESEEFGTETVSIRYRPLPDLPLVLENDANAVAWSVIRQTADAQESVANAIVVMGRVDMHGAIRVGVGLVVERRVYYGSRFDAGEFRSFRWRDGRVGELAADQVAADDWSAALVELLESLAVIVSTLRPDRIVFAGDLAPRTRELEDIARRQLAGSAVDPEVSHAAFAGAQGGEFAVSRGAADMFLEHLFALPSADRVRPAAVPFWDSVELTAD